MRSGKADMKAKANKAGVGISVHRPEPKIPEVEIHVK